MLAPRMLLHREPGHTRVAPEELHRRCDLFGRGLWPQLLHQATQAAHISQSAPRTMQPEDDGRACRAAALVHLGELSAAARALVAEPLAPGTDATLAELRDPGRRPAEPYAPLAMMRRMLGSTTSWPNAWRKLTSRLLPCSPPPLG